MEKKKNIIILILVALLFFISYCFQMKNKDLKHEMKESIKLRNALTDTITHYVNDIGEHVAEKKTLQASIAFFENENIILSNSQKNLFDRINKLENDKNIIAAALVESKIIIKNLEDSLNVVYDVVGDDIKFMGKNDHFRFGITVKNVKPLLNFTPKILFDSLYLYNEQFIDFQWDNDKKLNYPISFSISNSNPYFRVNNVESYAIPELDKNSVKPTNWIKFKNWAKNNWSNGLIFGVGVGFGYLMK